TTCPVRGNGLISDPNAPPPSICCTQCPIIIDVDGKGFDLTDADHGVNFDIRGTGTPLSISWTAAGSTNAFLCYDRDGTGLIDSGKELFGSFTDQPASTTPNGYLALSVFDKPTSGGNGDGVIDARDFIWPHLQLWQDTNHDGISQPGELHSLPDLGIQSIS